MASAGLQDKEQERLNLQALPPPAAPKQVERGLWKEGGRVTVPGPSPLLGGTVSGRMSWGRCSPAGLSVCSPAAGRGCENKSDELRRSSSGHEPAPSQTTPPPPLPLQSLSIRRKKNVLQKYSQSS